MASAFERFFTIPKARRAMLARLALSGVDPTDEELAKFREGKKFAPAVGDASPVTDPLAADNELQDALRSEELNRAVQTNRPEILGLKDTFQASDSDVDLSKIAKGRTAKSKALEQDLRLEALSNALDTPGLDPLLGADIANKNTISKPTRIKVRQKDGQDVFFDEFRTATGTRVERVEDANGRPLRVPPTAGSGLTTSQRDVSDLVKTFGITRKEAWNIKLALKRKDPKAAWGALVNTVLKLNFGRYARDPETLQKKTEEIWQVANPGVPVPQQGPVQPSGTVNADTSPAAEPQVDARQRALAEGFINLGNWIEGQGLEVFDENGSLIGYYN